ncbi:hypothetical protein GF366_04375 [Candidatus Peregrinibacteria bacterium]|nr:hypothetical protein [Candidatus Peregrinibacteria bacterium]
MKKTVLLLFCFLFFLSGCLSEREAYVKASAEAYCLLYDHNIEKNKLGDLIDEIYSDYGFETEEELAKMREKYETGKDFYNDFADEVEKCSSSEIAEGFRSD